MRNTFKRLLAVLGALALAVPALAQQAYTVGGGDVAIYNLAGEVEVVGANVSTVRVTVTRGGPDAEALDVQVGQIDGRQTLRVIYPDDRIVYGGRSGGGSTTITVNADGTWGNNGWGGDRVRISGRGSGLEAWADLRIEVPRGQELAVYLAVGEIMASDVDGDILLDTGSGGVVAGSMAGRLMIDTGSGDVEVRGMNGSLGIDTGSGGVTVYDVLGDAVEIDTGSGGVRGDGVEASSIVIDTGSGGIDLRRSAARDLILDTGSGSVEVELTADVDRLAVDTGSGSVTLRLPDNLGARVDIETGSGGIDSDFPVAVTRRERDELHGSIGDGNGSIVVDTGSGSVRIRRM